MTEGQLQGSRKPLVIVALAAFAVGILVALSIVFFFNRRTGRAGEESVSRYSSSPHSPGRGLPDEETAPEEETPYVAPSPGGPPSGSDRADALSKRRQQLDRQAQETLDRFSKMMNEMLHGGGTGPQEDLFKDLEEMEKKLYDRIDQNRRRLEEQRKQRGGAVPEEEEAPQGGGTLRFFSGGPDISQREDGANFYFDVKVEGYEKDSVKIRIDANVVTVEGRTTRAAGTGGESGGIQFSFSSSFARSIPVPPGGDSSKAEMSPEKGRIVVKIPKKKGGGP